MLVRVSDGETGCEEQVNERCCWAVHSAAWPRMWECPERKITERQGCLFFCFLRINDKEESGSKQILPMEVFIIIIIINCQ